MKQGNIGVTTENIFPVIKKFLYSDHEIFLREIVSNAVDATQKLKALAGKGEFQGELGELKVSVSIDKDAKTITIHGTPTKTGTCKYKVKTIGNQTNANATVEGALTINDPTDIESIETITTETIIHDLFGRRVYNPSNGIYIVNGRKVHIQ